MSKKNLVTREECLSNIKAFNGKVDKNHKEIEKTNNEVVIIKKALIGDDMRGGLVKDVQSIKSATGILRTTLLPVAISVVTAAIIYVIVK